MTHYPPELVPLMHLPWLNRSPSLITPSSDGLSSGLRQQILSLTPTSSMSTSLGSETCLVSGSCSEEPQTSHERHSFTSAPTSPQDNLPRALPEIGQTRVGQREPSGLPHQVIPNLPPGSLFPETTRSHPNDNWHDKTSGVSCS